MKKFLFTLLFGLCALMAHAENPTLIVRTARATGTPLTFKMRLPEAGQIAVDWGDGNKQTYAVNTQNTNVEGLLSGSVVKVYGNRINFFDCSDCDVVELDAAGAAELQQLYCGKNLIEALDISANTALVRLGCNDNRLSTLSIRKNPKLTGIYAQNNRFDATILNRLYADLPRRPKMPEQVTLRVKGNPGATVSNTEAATAKNWMVDLKGSNTGGKPIVIITNLAPGTQVTFEMRLTDAGYVEVDWGNGPQKAAVDTQSTRVSGTIAGNRITITGDGINFLKCERMGLVALDVQHAPQLQQLYCGFNALTAIDVTANKNLTRLGCNNNSIAAMDLSQNPKLSGLYLQNNQLDAKALNRIFDQIPARSKANPTVNFRVTGNPGSEKCRVSIATQKNWVVDIAQGQ